MGRWSYSGRRTVEECKSLDVKFLNDQGYFDGGFRWGRVKWTRNGEETGSVNLVVSITESNNYIGFQYTATDRVSGEKTSLDYQVRLTWTACRFGGRRWWFMCPLVINGCACNRRVGVLYLGDGNYFGCRHCYDLTYESSKESHSFDRMFLKMGLNPKEAKELFKREV